MAKKTVHPGWFVYCDLRGNIQHGLQSDLTDELGRSFYATDSTLYKCKRY